MNVYSDYPMSNSVREDFYAYQHTHALMPFPLFDEVGDSVKPSNVDRAMSRSLVEVSFQLRHNLIRTSQTRDMFSGRIVQVKILKRNAVAPRPAAPVVTKYVPLHSRDKLLICWNTTSDSNNISGHSNNSGSESFSSTAPSGSGGSNSSLPPVKRKLEEIIQETEAKRRKKST